jgi:hypothetical protein
MSSFGREVQISFETNVEYELGDRVGAFDGKNRSQRSCASVSLI